MRRVLFSIAAAASALAVATPASAQWAPRPVGYAAAYADPGALLTQVAQLRSQIRQLAMSNMLSPGEFRQLDWYAASLDQRVRRAAFNGLSPGEAYDVQSRIARLQQRIQLAAMSPNWRYGYGGYGGYGAYGAYGGVGAVLGRTSYYGWTPIYGSHVVQVVQRAPAPIANVMSGGLGMARMPSRTERNRAFSSGGRRMQRMPSSMRAERSFAFSSDGRGKGGARRGGGRGGRD